MTRELLILFLVHHYKTFRLLSTVLVWESLARSSSSSRGAEVLDVVPPLYLVLPAAPFLLGDVHALCRGSGPDSRTTPCTVRDPRRSTARTSSRAAGYPCTYPRCRSRGMRRRRRRSGCAPTRREDRRTRRRSSSTSTRRRTRRGESSWPQFVYFANQAAAPLNIPVMSVTCEVSHEPMC